MHLLVYFPSHRQAGHPYAGVLQWESAQFSQECHENLDSFCRSLRVPSPQNTVVVLIPDSREQLEEILSLGPLLEDHPLTVVLPTRDPAMVGRAHLLRPRFLTYQDQDPALLLAVVTNIAHRSWPGLEQAQGLHKPQLPAGKGRRRPLPLA